MLGPTRGVVPTRDFANGVVWLEASESLEPMPARVDTPDVSFRLSKGTHELRYISAHFDRTCGSPMVFPAELPRMRILTISVVWANFLLLLYVIYKFNVDAPGLVGPSAVASVAVLSVVLVSLHLTSTPKWFTWTGIIFAAMWGLRGLLMLFDTAVKGDPPLDESLPVALLTVSAAIATAFSLSRRLRST